MGYLIQHYLAHQLAHHLSNPYMSLCSPAAIQEYNERANNGQMVKRSEGEEEAGDQSP